MIETGILDKTKFISNFLLIALLAGNIYFSVQFIFNLQQPVLEDQTNTTMHIKATRLLKTFIDKVLNNQGTVSFEDRVQLENDILQMHDPVLTSAWNAFVSSKTSKEGQTSAVKLMSLLVERV